MHWSEEFTEIMREVYHLLNLEEFDIMEERPEDAVAECFLEIAQRLKKNERQTSKTI